MEALDFGKYNFYVWTCYGLTLFILALNIVLPWLEKKKLLKRIKRKHYLENIK